MPTCKRKLFIWLSEIIKTFNSNSEKDGVKHCWEQIDMLTAWDRDVQAAAMCNASFRDLPQACEGAACGGRRRQRHTTKKPAGRAHRSPTEVGETKDDEIGYMGWLNTIDWDRV